MSDMIECFINASSAIQLISSINSQSLIHSRCKLSENKLFADEVLMTFSTKCSLSKIHFRKFQTLPEKQPLKDSKRVKYGLNGHDDQNVFQIPSIFPNMKCALNISFPVPIYAKILITIFSNSSSMQWPKMFVNKHHK